MNYHFAYLVGALLFDAAWAVCYLLGKKYRPQMISGTAVTVPLALTSFLFVPQYWTPPSLFDLDARFRVGFEYLHGYRFAPGQRLRFVEASRQTGDLKMRG